MVLAASGTDVSAPVANPWIKSRGFDLGFLTLSAVLVFLPYVSYGLLQKMGISVGRME